MIAILVGAGAVGVAAVVVYLGGAVRFAFMLPRARRAAWWWPVILLLLKDRYHWHHTWIQSGRDDCVLLAEARAGLDTPVNDRSWVTAPNPIRLPPIRLPVEPPGVRFGVLHGAGDDGSDVDL